MTCGAADIKIAITVVTCQKGIEVMYDDMRIDE